MDIEKFGGKVPSYDAAGAIIVTNAGASATDQVQGNVAHDAVDAGNPVKTGGKAVGSLPAAVANADRADSWYDRHGRQHTRGGHQSAASNVWAVSHLPADNAQATITQAAGGTGVRNVCTELTIVFAAGPTAPTAVNTSVSLIDGASGGTTYLWRATISLPATGGAMNGIALPNLWLPGTANTPLTLEFLAAGGANTIESVTMSGITLTE